MDVTTQPPAPLRYRLDIGETGMALALVEHEWLDVLLYVHGGLRMTPALLPMWCVTLVGADQLWAARSGVVVVLWT